VSPERHLSALVRWVRSDGQSGSAQQEGAEDSMQADSLIMTALPTTEWELSFVEELKQRYRFKRPKAVAHTSVPGNRGRLKASKPRCPSRRSTGVKASCRLSIT
jgi:hypothetical protein